MRPPRGSKDILRYFIPLALIGTVVLGVMYVNEQQSWRMSANEPQLGMAEDEAAAIADTPPGPSTLSGSIPIESADTPYLVIYDTYGTPITGTGYLHGVLPTLPAGIFDVVRSKGEDRLTWQPETGVRQAIVVVPVGGGAGGFVMGGRSLAYTELMEQQLTLRTLLGFVGMLFAAALGAYLGARWRK